MAREANTAMEKRTSDTGSPKVAALWELCFLILAWGFWSGRHEVLLLCLGLMSCLFVFGLSNRMRRIAAKPPARWQLVLRSSLYLPWLVIEVVKANLSLSRIILSPRLRISPRLLRLKALQESELGQVIFANSITLTPGTVTLNLQDGELLVHALTAASAEELREGAMNRRVRSLEGKG